MKKLILVTALAICSLLCGCSGVSQVEYDTLKTEYENLVESSNELESQKSELESKNEELQSQLEELQREYDELEDEYEAYWNEQTAEQLKAVVPKAWAMTYFGEDCLVIPSDNGEYIQIICQKEYQVSVESLQELWNSMLASMPDLEACQNEIEWERIGIKFLQEDGMELLEFVFKKTDGNFLLESMNGDLLNSSFLVVALSNM